MKVKSVRTASGIQFVDKVSESSKHCKLTAPQAPTTAPTTDSASASSNNVLSAYSTALATGALPDDDFWGHSAPVFIDEGPPHSQVMPTDPDMEWPEIEYIPGASVHVP